MTTEYRIIPYKSYGRGYIVQKRVLRIFWVTVLDLPQWRCRKYPKYFSNKLEAKRYIDYVAQEPEYYP